MTEIYGIGGLLRYKSWADDVLYDSLGRLADDKLTEQRPMLFGNILSLLNHVFAMDVAWRSNLQGGVHDMQTRNPENPPAFAELREKQSAINDWYREYAGRLADSELNELVEFTFIGGGEGCMRRGEILHHVVNHATYHRGHIEGALYQMGVEPGTTDLPVFLREGGLLIGGSWT